MSRIWEMKGGKYVKALTKFQVRGIFRIRDKRFTQIYRDLHGEGILVPIQMSTNMAYGNQQKHLLPSFATKA